MRGSGGSALWLAALLAGTGAAWAAQVDLELFAPAREAAQALQAARRARAAELAPGDLRLADLYFEEARAALMAAAGTPDEAQAGQRFRLASAAARVAETRALEVVAEREAAAAGFEYLDTLEGDPKRMLPPRPPLGMAMAEYRRLQREAADARRARRAAEAALEQLRARLR